MPTLTELRALLDSTGKPICSSSGAKICTPCSGPNVPGGDCCLFTHGACIALDPTSGVLDVTGGNPMVMSAEGFLPFGTSTRFQVGVGWSISGQTVIAGQTLCYDVRVLVALRCPDDDQTKVEVRAVAAGGRLNEWSPTCWQSLDYYLLWWWTTTYGYLVVPDLELVTPLTTITWNCLTTPADIPFSTTVNFYNLADGSLVFAVPMTWNIKIKPQSSPCVFTGGVDPCFLYDYAGGVNGRFWEGLWTPSCVYSCPCSGIPDNPGDPPPPPPPPPPDHTMFACCPGRTAFATELTASITGIAAGFPFSPGCDECLDGTFPFFWGPTTGPFGESGWTGTFVMGAACLPGFENYRYLVVQAYCLDGVNWIPIANFRAPLSTGLPDIFVEATLVVAPCTPGYPENYFEIALNMNPGTNCAAGCPCYGGAYVIVGP